MATNVHMRNPWDYIDIARDINHPYFSWDYGSPKIRLLDPLKFLKLRLGDNYEFTAYSVAVEGMAEYNQDSVSLDRPEAVYPIWHPDHGWDKLEKFCQNPVGEDPELYSDKKIPSGFRPVKGQPHRILIYDFPDIGSFHGRQWFLRLLRIQEEYPDVDFIAHGTTSFRAMFVGRFYAATYNPEFLAKKNAAHLPSGQRLLDVLENRDLLGPWANAFGMRVTDLYRFPRLTQFNMFSVLWASQYYLDEEAFRIAKDTRTFNDLPEDLPESDPRVKKSRVDLFIGSVPRPAAASLSPGDGVICDDCTLANRCRLYREGAVCGVPSTDSAKLARLMGSRDADQLIEGLSEIAKVQAERVGKDLQEEEDSGKRFPETDKRLKDLFDSGQKIARLVRPELNGRGVQVNVGVMGGTAVVQQRTPQELVSGAIRALEEKGIPRERITEDAILGLLEGVTSRKGAELLEDVVDAELVE